MGVVGLLMNGDAHLLRLVPSFLGEAKPRHPYLGGGDDHMVHVGLALGSAHAVYAGETYRSMAYRYTQRAEIIFRRNFMLKNSIPVPASTPVT